MLTPSENVRLCPSGTEQRVRYFMKRLLVIAFCWNQDEKALLASPLKASPLKASPLKASPLKASPLVVRPFSPSRSWMDVPVSGGCAGDSSAGPQPASVSRSTPSRSGRGSAQVSRRRMSLNEAVFMGYPPEPASERFAPRGSEAEAGSKRKVTLFL